MGLQLDLLKRIVNVHWRGGVFVFAEHYGNKLYCVQFSEGSPDIKTITLAEPPNQDPDSVLPLFGISGATFALVGDAAHSRPVFLVCGLAVVGNEVTFADRNSRIYRSADGQTWSRVLDWHTGGSDDSQGASVNGLVWDPDASLFYFNQGDHVRISEDAFTVKDEIFSSTDGQTWARISSVDNELNPDFVSPFSTVHCAHNNCVDSYTPGHHVPDGVHWQDDDSQMIARPTDPPDVNYVQGGVNFTPGSNAIEIIKAGIKTSASIPGVACVTCVAGAGGILMAGGFTSQEKDGPGAVAYSLDDGKTWQLLASTATGVTTMVAGSLPSSPAPPARTGNVGL